MSAEKPQYSELSVACLVITTIFQILSHTESENGDIGRGQSGSSGPISLLKQCHPKVHGTEFCPDSS